MSTLRRIGMTALAAGIVGGCSDPIPVPSTVTVSPASANLAALGDEVQLTAVVKDQNGSPMPDAAVSWSSGTPSVATVDANGLVEAAGPGAATITASSGSISGTVAVRVEQVPATVVVSPDSLDFDAFGDKATLAAVVSDRNGHEITGAAVNWLSGNTAVAVVDGAGRVEPVGNGAATITASSGPASGTAAVTVEQVAVAVTVSPDSLNFDAFGDTATLAAVVSDRNGYEIEGAAVAWSSGDTAVAVVDGGGRVESAGNGAAIITAASGTVSATAAVAVSQVPAEVAVSPDSLNFDAFGDTVTLAAVVFDRNGYEIRDAEVAWTSGDTTVAVVDRSGRVEPAGNGTATITAASGPASGAAAVSVGQVPAEVVVSPGSLVFDALGDTITLAAVVSDRNGYEIRNAEVAWSSGDAAVAVVDGSGRVESAGNGAATITAASGTASATAGVTVEQVAVAVAVSPDSLNFDAFGDTATLAAVVSDRNGYEIERAEVDWTTGNGRVAVVDGSGRVESAGNGAATITAASGTVSATAAVAVSQVPAEVVVSPDSLEFDALGDTVTVAAVVSDRNGYEIQDAEVEWLSGDTAVAVVDRGGRVEPVGNGVTTIAVTSGPAAATVSVMVEQVPTAVVVSPDSLVFGEFGDTATLAAVVSDRNGYEIERAEVDWTTGNGRVAVVGDNGLVRTIGEGTTFLGAQSGAAADTAWVSVVSVDRKVLRRLYEATDGRHWINNANWLTAEPLSSWHGVSVNSRGRVTKLVLSNNGLVGEIPPELEDLGNMWALDLSRNSLTGQIPPELGKLRHLSSLGLGSNSLTGQIPPELGNIANLQWLHLNHNALTGPIPAELGKLTRLWALVFSANNLTGTIPKELGDLENLRYLQLYDNALTGPIPTELGGLEHLANLLLDNNDLTGAIPPELGDLDNLGELHLHWNNLTGPIPPELGGMESLTSLRLNDNDLTGPIPPELGNLEHLRTLNLNTNDLTGQIPPELGDLADLSWLNLENNSLTGQIPPELGDPADMHGLLFSNNNLTGPIPPELGDLEQLRYLHLNDNDLDDSIPAELGDLSHLINLHLDKNALIGSIPAELGDLESLQMLLLNDNDLTGPVPAELGGLGKLVHFRLGRNTGMSGVLPDSLTMLGSLESLLAGDTGLCAPADSDFLAWLNRVVIQRVALCSPAAAYLTQFVQSREHPVPLVAREKSLLRAFVTAANPGKHTMPRVVARFYRDNKEVHKADIAASSNPIPKEIDESSLKASANAVIPDSVVRPGLELVVDVDPDSTLHDSVGVVRRIPAKGRLAVGVLEAPLFDLTVIPFLYEPDPDSSIIETTKAMADEEDEHGLLNATTHLLAVGDMQVTAHSPVEVSSNSGYKVLGLTGMIRHLEGGTGYWQGMMPGFSDVGGIAILAGRISAVGPSSGVIAHELGHNFFLYHAPCGGAAGPDPDFPEPNGSIGAWGYALDSVNEVSKGELVSPTIPDIMSYCGPWWISDFYFSKMFRFRIKTEGGAFSTSLPPTPQRSLLLWGGIHPDRGLHLEPAFVVDAPPALPGAAGDHTIEGRDVDGGLLFSVDFEMSQVADAGEGAGMFTFLLPVRPEWEEELASITLTGPGGPDEAVWLDGGTDVPMAIHRDRVTGEVRAILRGAAAGGDPPPGMDVMRSRGIPGPDAWRREQ